MNMKELMAEGRALPLYEDSEKADAALGEEGFDFLWQSIFDVYRLARNGILEDISEEELSQAMAWLCKSQEYTTIYQDIGIPF